MSQNTEPFVEGVEISAKKIHLKQLFNKTIFILIIIQGMRGLFITVKDIFVVYPKISTYYKELGFDQGIYTQILYKVALVSATSFIETAFGITMAVKKSGSVKIVHTVLGIIILLLSLYLKREGALPDFDTIEKLAYFIRP